VQGIFCFQLNPAC